MVIAGVAISEKKLPKLKKLGVRDSKLLTPKQRFKLYDKIIKLVDSYSIIEISPQEIDQRNAVGTNLNQLEAIKIAQILTELKPDKVFVDSPEPNRAQKFGDMILQYLDGDSWRRSVSDGGVQQGHGLLPEIIAEHKSDILYPIVSAASILAKVTRDLAVQQIEKEIGKPIGSGYPSDPICQEFLDKHFNDNHIHHIRKCWVTYQVLKEKKTQSNLTNW